ncbi:MAG: hypothetical protein PHG04_03110 [Candidatus Nanoarchaeia archaeon]|nr:hypothetical protein [Candidatus Nanoarchaeia archaeon]
MINQAIKSFEKDFGCEPIFPKNCGIFNDSIALMSRELKEMDFKISPFSKGAVLFKKHAFSSLLEINKKRVKNFLVLNEKSSFLFTCGRTIFEKGVLKKKGKGPNYLVLNEKNEVLGVAFHEKSGLKNKVNIGYYLNQDKLSSPVF